MNFQLHGLQGAILTRLFSEKSDSICCKKTHFSSLYLHLEMFQRMGMVAYLVKASCILCALQLLELELGFLVLRICCALQVTTRV